MSYTGTIPQGQSPEISAEQMEQCQDLTAQHPAPVTLAHLHRIHAQEIHDMRMKVLQEELAAQNSFWEEKERLLQSESRDKLESAEEIKDAELKSIVELHDIQVQNREERRKLDLSRLTEYHDLRNRLQEQDYEACDNRQMELHELRKADLLKSDDESDGEVEDEDEEENEEEEEDSPTPVVPVYSDIEYERCMANGSRKRQRLMLDEPI